jgi:hypothetical protein
MTKFALQDATIQILYITGANPKLNLTSTLERLYLTSTLERLYDECLEESRSNNNPKEA